MVSEKEYNFNLNESVKIKKKINIIYICYIIFIIFLIFYTVLVSISDINIVYKDITNPMEYYLYGGVFLLSTIVCIITIINLSKKRSKHRSQIKEFHDSLKQYLVK